MVFIAGCWDLFHIGHLNVLEKAASLGDFLVVGVATREHIQALRAYKGVEVIPFAERERIVGALKCVDATVPYEMDDFSVFDNHDVGIWAVGAEHGTYEFEGRTDRELERRGVKCVVLARTPDISTGILKERIIEGVEL